MGAIEFDTFVIFIDMLGFADLVETEGHELMDYKPIFRGIELHAPSVSKSLLRERFVNFHRCLQTARTKLQEGRSGTAIVFSDSAFFQVDNFESALEFSRQLMYSLIVSNVPARAGIARGSFRFLRFMTDASDQVSHHMSQFLGTGVVRAYRTEQCGAPGIRILLNPNLEPLIADKTALGIIEVVPAPPRVGVQSELNYLGRDAEASAGLPAAKADVIVLDAVRNMRNESAEAAHHHYAATFAAINRMRAQFGRPEYTPDQIEGLPQ